MKSKIWTQVTAGPAALCMETRRQAVRMGSKEKASWTGTKAS